MIPTLEQIWADLKSGLITLDQAIHWVGEHMRLASDSASGDLRDSLAMAAMQSLILTTNGGGGEIRKQTPQGVLIVPGREGIPTMAYEYADAMLAARATA